MPGRDDSSLSFRQEDVSIHLYPSVPLVPEDIEVELDDYALRVRRNGVLIYSFDLCRAVKKDSLQVHHRDDGVEITLEFTEAAQHPKPVQREDQGEKCPCVEHPRLNPRGADQDEDS
jgi:hypothetical protein